MADNILRQDGFAAGGKSVKPKHHRAVAFALPFLKRWVMKYPFTRSCSPPLSEEVKILPVVF